MTEKLQKTIEEEIKKLPPEARAAVASVDWVKITEEIGAANNLEEEEIEDFQLETLLCIIGATDLEYYATNIENEVNTTEEKAKTLSKEAIDKIFNPISQSFETKMKEALKYKKTTWQQSVDFVLSGGNYGVFLNENSTLEEYSEPKSEGGGNNKYNN